MTTEANKMVQTLEVRDSPFHDYAGRPRMNLHCCYVNARQTMVTGEPCLQSILAAAGIKPQPGDVLKVTIEVSKSKEGA